MLFPLQGTLITGPQCEDWLREALRKGASDARLCSAFFRSETLSRLLSNRKSDIQGNLLVRWRLEDILVGASDLALFPVCQELGLGLYLRLDFHGKVYALPSHGIAVGSANATASGLGYGPSPNAEVCTLVDCSTANWNHVNELYVGATRVDQRLFDLLSVAVADVPINSKVGEWPEEIMNQLTDIEAPKKLLVDECLHSSPDWWAPGALPNAAAGQHDLELMGLSANASLADLQHHMRQLRIVRWLGAQLQAAPSSELYFGNLSALLHSALLDDPGPHRREVKVLLQNLLSWCQRAELAEIRIDRPNYSQRVTLLQSKK